MVMLLSGIYLHSSSACPSQCHLQGWIGTIGVVVRMSTLDTNVDGSIPSIKMFSPRARDFIRIASVDSAVKWVPGGDNLVKGVQWYELFGGIALTIHTFSGG